MSIYLDTEVMSRAAMAMLGNHIATPIEKHMESQGYRYIDTVQSPLGHKQHCFECGHETEFPKWKPKFRYAG